MVNVRLLLGGGIMTKSVMINAILLEEENNTRK